MKKKIISLVLALTFVLSSVFSANAASYITDGQKKIPTELTLKDLDRLSKVMSTVRGKTAYIVNAKRYNDNGTTWIVRMSFGEEGDQCAGDFVVNCYPYARDPKTQEINTLPFKTVEEGTKMFGPCWYFFGLFDDLHHNSCGFAVAERIKRWPSWRDYSFSKDEMEGQNSGRTYRGVVYSGSYTEEMDVNFVANHTKAN